MRKQIALGALALTTAVVLAGCAGGSTDEGDADSGEGSGVELVVWTDAEREQAIADAAVAFEA